MRDVLSRGHHVKKGEEHLCEEVVFSLEGAGPPFPPPV